MSSLSRPSFLSAQVDAFYAYMASVYLEYYQCKEKPTIKINKKKESTEKVQGDVESNNESKDKDNDNNDIVEIQEQTFPEYFLFKLYYNYGIKRRNVAPNIALLFYDKATKGYKENELITMLCRHMMLDMRNMRIISLGIPKAMKLEKFYERMKINPDDIHTNTTGDTTGDNLIKFTMYRFPEGTMMTYNPSLIKYNVSMNECVNNDENAGENGEGVKEAKKHADAIEATIQQQFSKHLPPKQMQYSTRKVSGTGRFSSLKTFMEMFNENNALAGVNMELIPEGLIQDKVLVFNIEHFENRVISANIRNYNTLCAVYEFKIDEECTKAFEVIQKLDLQQGCEISSENSLKITNAFCELGRDMVVSLDLKIFNNKLAEYGVNLNLPDSIRQFGNNKKTEARTEARTETDNDESKIIHYWKLSFNQLNDIVQSRPKDFQGYIIYGADGCRTKIVNNKYKELKILKGNKPIVIEEWNTKNLFYLYWRLVKLQMIPQFITEFDISGGWSYNQLFYWFATLARGYAINLFRVYHNSFVKKSMDKYNIPHSMKPMCGDLHNMYKENKIPISQSMVEQYLFSQSAGKIFWRLFSGK